MAALDAIDAAHDTLAALSWHELTPRELVQVLARRERAARRHPVVDHTLINRLVAECPPIELGATTMPKALAHALKLSVKDAKRRIDEAADLGPRTAWTGEPLEPKLPHVAQAQAAGQLGPEHLKTIREFFNNLPSFIDPATRIDAEAELAKRATQFGPEYFRKGPDGMTPFSGHLDPEGRAVWEAVMAKLAAPGMCNADDPTPCVDGHPCEDQAQDDTRTAAQRLHSRRAHRARLGPAR